MLVGTMPDGEFVIADAEKVLMLSVGAIDHPGLFILFLIFQFASAFLLTPLEVITTRKLTSTQATLFRR